MYVCICKGITDREVQAAIDDGCSSLRELRSELGVASNCGKCAGYARELLAESKITNPAALVGQFQPQPAI